MNNKYQQQNGDYYKDSIYYLNKYKIHEKNFMLCRIFFLIEKKDYDYSIRNILWSCINKIYPYRSSISKYFKILDLIIIGLVIFILLGFFAYDYKFFGFNEQIINIPYNLKYYFDSLLWILIHSFNIRFIFEI